MTSSTYKAALQKAKGELANAIKQRDYWNLEIARLQQLVKGLTASVEKKNSAFDNRELFDVSEVGITELVLSVIRSYDAPRSATDIRDALQASGYDFSKYANPLALIHQTLKRLAADGRIVDQRDGNYKKRSAFYGGGLPDVPNPFGHNLSEMLTPEKNKKK